KIVSCIKCYKVVFIVIINNKINLIVQVYLFTKSFSKYSFPLCLSTYLRTIIPIAKGITMNTKMESNSVPIGTETLPTPNKSATIGARSEEHTSELQSRFDLVCRLLLEKKKQNK